jgi:hypothetical protein
LPIAIVVELEQVVTDEHEEVIRKAINKKRGAVKSIVVLITGVLGDVDALDLGQLNYSLFLMRFISL